MASTLGRLSTEILDLIYRRLGGVVRSMALDDDEQEFRVIVLLNSEEISLTLRKIPGGEPSEQAPGA
jgi:hypothetical protein